MSKKYLAFTLIELLVVIAIIGILSGLIVVSMSGVTSKANIAKAQVFSNSLRNSLMLNLISEWKFDELNTAVDGTTIQDSWGSVNNGTLDINTLVADTSDKLKSGANCVSGKCLSFDGVDDYVYVSGSDSASSNLAITGEISLSSWVKFGVAGTDVAIAGRGACRSSNGNYGYGFSRIGSNNLIRFDMYSTTTRDYLDSVSVFNDTNWHFIVVTWNGTTGTNGKKIYVDGKLDNQGTSGISSMGQPVYYFIIGKSSASSSYYFNGSIDDVRVFNAVVPSFQIKEQYYAGLNQLLINGGIKKEEYLSRVKELVAQK
jgi:prepilin-type N-terminal cleavage/methylation domain-containing protein